MGQGESLFPFARGIQTRETGLRLELVNRRGAALLTEMVKQIGESAKVMVQPHEGEKRVIRRNLPRSKNQAVKSTRRSKLRAPNSLRNTLKTWFDITTATIPFAGGREPSSHCQALDELRLIYGEVAVRANEASAAGLDHAGGRATRRPRNAQRSVAVRTPPDARTSP